MTIQGAVYELEQMLSRTDIPDYIKPTIKKVIETVVDDINQIYIPKDVLDKICAEIIKLKREVDITMYGMAIDDVLEIIDKYKESEE